MSLPPLLPKGAQRSRLLLRLTIIKISLAGLLMLVGLIYAFLSMIAGTGIWLPAFRLLLAVVLVALAFVDNAIRFENPPPPTPEGEPATVANKWLPIPPALQTWWTYFQQNLAMPAVLSLLAMAWIMMAFTLLCFVMVMKGKRG